MIKALLIKGVEESLQYLDNDIQMVQESFGKIGISVETVFGDKFRILTTLSNIIDELNSTDTLIVYYTGHGVIHNKKLAFPVDNQNKNTDRLSINELMENTGNAKTENIVLILDCCYATAVEITWKDYAAENHILFLPSSQLEAVEEIEEYKASFFTYCMCCALDSNDEALYKDDKITLESLYNVTKEYAKLYNKKKFTIKPIPELIGGRKEIILGFRGKKKKSEEKIQKYLNDFIYCVEKCEKLCSEEQVWCSTIFKSDANIYQYVIPSVREFITKQSLKLIKLDAFFDSWFNDQNSYLGLLGDMGVGKTTACVYLFYYLAKKYDNKIYTYIPVYFPLNELGNQLQIESNIYKVIKSFINPKITLEEIKDLCKRRRLVFILDGFDEISGDSSISTILHNYNGLKPFMRFKCKTVLTCRTHYFSEQDQLEEVLTGKTQGTDFAVALLNDEYPFNIVELQEFTEKEILELIALLVPGEDKKRIWNKIGDIYDLKDLAKRAILLKMIVKTLPELQKKNQKVNSATLYLLYTQKLLRREIETRKIGLELSEKENFIGYIANLMFINDELVIGTRKFDKEIKQYFKNSLYSRETFNNYNYDCKVSTFFSRDQNDNYRFIHKSFYEYYFSRYCICQIGEDNFAPWSARWFPREIAIFIKELLENKKYMCLIPKIIETSLNTKNSVLIWNTLHIISLLDIEIIEKYLVNNMKLEYIKRGEQESRSVIIRQYCRIIAKFIDRKSAENLIDKIIMIVKSDPKENDDNDRTYYNYYGGKNAAINAWIKHLSVRKPKYDAKLHLYLLEHLATKEYLEKIKNAIQNWENIEGYEEDISRALTQIEKRF